MTIVKQCMRSRVHLNGLQSLGLFYVGNNSHLVGSVFKRHFISPDLMRQLLMTVKLIESVMPYVMR